jgi:hypothetical protein
MAAERGNDGKRSKRDKDGSLSSISKGSLANIALPRRYLYDRQRRAQIRNTVPARDAVLLTNHRGGPRRRPNRTMQSLMPSALAITETELDALQVILDDDLRTLFDSP